LNTSLIHQIDREKKNLTRKKFIFVAIYKELYMNDIYRTCSKYLEVNSKKNRFD